MYGVVVLPTWMLRLDGHFKKNLERIIDYQLQHSLLLHISELFSLFNFILSQTNRKVRITDKICRINSLYLQKFCYFQLYSNILYRIQTHSTLSLSRETSHSTLKPALKTTSKERPSCK